MFGFHTKNKNYITNELHCVFTKWIRPLPYKFNIMFKYSRIEDLKQLDFTDGGNASSYNSSLRYHRLITDCYEWPGEIGCFILSDRDYAAILYLAIWTEEMINEEYANWYDWQSLTFPKLGVQKTFATQILANGKNHLIFKKHLFGKNHINDYELLRFSCPC